MAFRLTFEPDHQVVVVEIEGAMTAAVARDVLGGLWTHPDYAGLSLWDFRAASLDGLQGDELLSIGEYIRQNRPPIERVRAAFLAGAGADFGLARMTENYMASVATAIRTFTAREEALAWLIEPPSGV